MLYTNAYPSLNKVGHFESVPLFLTVECIRHKCDLHFHNYTQLWYVMSGTLKQNINGTEYIQTPGSCSIILPYVRHSIDLCDSEDTPLIISVSFPDSSLTKFGYDYFSYVSSYAHFDGKAIPQIVFPSAERKEHTDKAVRDLISEFSEDELSADTLCTLLAQLLRNFCTEKCTNLPTPMIKEQANAITDAVTYIQKHANDAITLDRLCSVAAMSRTSFSNKFKEITGMTFSQFHLALKIDKATDLLSFSDKSFTEISREVGLYDNARLTHAFKEVFNLPPSKVKQLIKSYKLEMRELSIIRQKRFNHMKF